MANSSAVPRVLLSEGALTRNASAIAAGAVADLRHDAYGHGVIESARIVRDAGAAGVLVDADDVERVSRIGIAARAEDVGQVIDPHRLFGIPAGRSGAQAEPVMRLEGRVLATKPLRAGEAVSYGYTHRAIRDTRVALVTGGYAQGILRALGNRAQAQIADRAHPIVGRIAMDVCVLDLDGEDAELGASVTFFGGDGAMRDGLAHWADATGLTALEMAVVIGRHGYQEWTA